MKTVKPWLMMAGLLTVWGISTAAVAEESKRLDMEGTSIKGNEEHPKVLFVIPWKAKDSAPLRNGAPEIKADIMIEPLERSDFRSAMYYRKHRTVGDLP
jgi:hypothetical protein